MVIPLVEPSSEFSVNDGPKCVEVDDWQSEQDRYDNLDCRKIPKIFPNCVRNGNDNL